MAASGADRPPPSGPDEEGTPRWVKLFGLIVILLLVLFVAQHLLGGGFGRHMP